VVFVGEDEAASQKTKVCNSDLNPVWDETLSFAGVKEGDTLTVKVFDSDTFGSDDVIGEVKIPFEEVVASGGKSKWYKVEGDEAGDGEVEIGFDMTPKPLMWVEDVGGDDNRKVTQNLVTKQTVENPARTRNEDSGRGNKRVDESDDEDSEHSHEREQAVVLTPGAIAQLFASTSKYQIQVQMKAGRNMPAMDMDGTSDPYAVVFVGEDEAASQKTKVCNSDLNPVWDETLSFAGVKEGDTLTVKVFDSDTFGSDDFIGEVKIGVVDAMKQYLTAGGAKWYKVEGSEAGDGEVEIGFDITPKPMVSSEQGSRLASSGFKSGGAGSFHTAASTGADRAYTSSMVHGGGYVGGSSSSYSGGYFAHDEKNSERLSQLALSEPRLALALENPSIKWENYGLEGLSAGSRRKGIEVGAQTSTLLAATSRGGYGASAVRFGSIMNIGGGGKETKYTPVKMQACKSPSFAVDFGGAGARRRRSLLQMGMETEVVWEFEIDGANGACTAHTNKSAGAGAGAAGDGAADAPQRCVVTLFHSASDGRCIASAEINGRRIEEVVLSKKEKEATAAATGGAVTGASATSVQTKGRKGANESEEESEETDSESEDEAKVRGSDAAVAAVGDASAGAGGEGGGIVGALFRVLLGGGSMHAFRLPLSSPGIVVAVEVRMEGSLLSAMQHFYSYRLTIGGSPAYQTNSGCDHSLSPHRNPQNCSSASTDVSDKLPPSALSIGGAKYQPLERRYQAAVEAIDELTKQAQAGHADSAGTAAQGGSPVPLQGASAAMLQALKNQAEIGDCEAVNARGPSILDVHASAVWHAWRACGAMDRDEAMAGFIDEAHRVLLLARPTRRS
jgi:hypothetical protein